MTGSAAWTYDNNYRATARTVNGANSLSFVYDADDMPTAVGALTLGRNAQNGLLTGTTLGSVSDVHTYSSLAEVSGYSASAGSTALYSESYVRDNLGRITQRTEILQGVTTTWGYSYDVPGRLSTVTRNGVAFESYTYDTNDNRLTKTTTAGTTTSAYDNQDRLLSSTGSGGTQTRTYDSNGDLLTRTNASGTTVFDYETGGQLLSVAKPGGPTVSYDLDAGNKRAAKRVNGVAQKKWLYAGGLLPVAEYDASNNLTAVFNGGYMVKNGTTYRLLRDHLGSVRLVVDASTGGVAQRLSYGPFGEVLEDTNPGFQPFGYAGGLYDPDTGLVRFGARDYDPAVGRWTCAEKISLAALPNAYVYCNQDPIDFIDPWGLDGYSTADAAARAAYDDFGNITESTGLEIGGVIYSYNGKFYYSKEFAVGSKYQYKMSGNKLSFSGGIDSDNLKGIYAREIAKLKGNPEKPNTCPKFVAIYHTHPSVAQIKKMIEKDLDVKLKSTKGLEQNSEFSAGDKETALLFKSLSKAGLLYGKESGIYLQNADGAFKFYSTDGTTRNVK